MRTFVRGHPNRTDTDTPLRGVRVVRVSGPARCPSLAWLSPAIDPRAAVRSLLVRTRRIGQPVRVVLLGPPSKPLGPSPRVWYGIHRDPLGDTADDL
jgi:hypothetical protein